MDPSLEVRRWVSRLAPIAASSATRIASERTGGNFVSVRQNAYLKLDIKTPVNNHALKLLEVGRTIARIASKYDATSIVRSGVVEYSQTVVSADPGRDRPTTPNSSDSARGSTAPDTLRRASTSGRSIENMFAMGRILAIDPATR